MGYGIQKYNIGLLEMGKLSKKKSGCKPLKIPIAIPKDAAPKTETMDYEESFKYTSWAMERKSANKILTNVKKKGFNVKLDDLTQGKGSLSKTLLFGKVGNYPKLSFLGELGLILNNQYTVLVISFVANVLVFFSHKS